MAILPPRVSHILMDYHGVATTNRRPHPGVMRFLAGAANRGVHISVVTTNRVASAKEVLAEFKRHGLDSRGIRNLNLLPEDGRIVLNPQNERHVVDPSLKRNPLNTPRARAKLAESIREIHGLEPDAVHQTAFFANVILPAAEATEPFLRRTHDQLTRMLERMRYHDQVHVESIKVVDIDGVPHAFKFVPKLGGKPLGKGYGAIKALELVAAKTGLSVEDVAHATIVLGDNVGDFEMCTPHGLDGRTLPGFFSGDPAELGRFRRPDTLFGHTEEDGPRYSEAVHEMLEENAGVFAPFSRESTARGSKRP